MKRAFIILFLLTVSYASAEPAGSVPAGGNAGKDALFEDLTANMACLCGCGTTIKTCPHENCGSAVPARKELHEMIDTGLGRQEIIAKMVSRHGEAIMAAPAFSGFNLMAWTMPFAAIIAFGFLAAQIIKKWSAKPVASQGAKPPAEVNQEDPYLKKVRDEIGRYEE